MLKTRLLRVLHNRHCLFHHKLCTAHQTIVQNGSNTLHTAGKQSPNGTKQRHRSAQKKVLHMQDKAWAIEVSKTLGRNFNLDDPSLVVIEFNPGPGVLIEAILENSSATVIGLTHKWSNKSSRKQCHERYLTGEYNGVYFTSTIRQLLSENKGPGDITQRKVPRWDEECPVKIIGSGFPASKYSSYITMLSEDIASQTVCYGLGRVENYLFLDPSEIQLATAVGGKLFKKGSLRSAFYRLLFDVTPLMQIPLEAFEFSGSVGKGVDRDGMYLTQLVPRRDVFESVCSREHLPSFIALLKALRRARAKRVIPTAEGWCPGVGMDLIFGGFTMLCVISELSPQQVILLHNILSAHPSFRHFHADVDNLT